MNANLENSKEFSLEEDFYALCYVSYLNENAQKYNLSPQRQSRFFYSVLWVFMLQAALLYLALNELIFAPAVAGQLYFLVYGYETFLAQFIAATLLHMELVREVQQGIYMIKYLAANP